MAKKKAAKKVAKKKAAKRTNPSPRKRTSTPPAASPLPPVAPVVNPPAAPAPTPAPAPFEERMVLRQPDQKGRAVELVQIDKTQFVVRKPRTLFSSEPCSREKAEGIYKQQRLNPHSK